MLNLFGHFLARSNRFNEKRNNEHRINIQYNYRLLESCRNRRNFSKKGNFAQTERYKRLLVTAITKLLSFIEIELSRHRRV